MDEKTSAPRTKYTWKPPVDRLDEVEALIAESGLSFNAFMTQCALEKRRSSYPPILKKSAGQLLAFLGPIRDHTRRLETAPHDDQRIIILLQIRDLLLEIRAALFLILGRKP